MEQVFERVCGLDVHKATIAACVRVPDAKGKRVLAEFTGDGPDLRRRARRVSALGAGRIEPVAPHLADEVELLLQLVAASLEWVAMEKGSTKGQEAAKKPQADGAAPTFAPGQNSVTGEVHRRGPDRKPRQVARLGFTRALVAAQVRDGRPISGFEDMTLALRRILGDDNHRYFLGIVTLTKEIFDDAQDSGSGRTTVFLFPSEVEAERRQAAGQAPAESKPEGSSSPLAGMEELEEPPG